MSKTYFVISGDFGGSVDEFVGKDKARKFVQELVDCGYDEDEIKVIEGKEVDIEIENVKKVVLC